MVKRIYIRQLRIFFLISFIIHFLFFIMIYQLFGEFKLQPIKDQDYKEIEVSFVFPAIQVNPKEDVQKEKKQSEIPLINIQKEIEVKKEIEDYYPLIEPYQIVKMEKELIRTDDKEVNYQKENQKIQKERIVNEHKESSPPEKIEDNSSINNEKKNKMAYTEEEIKNPNLTIQKFHFKEILKEDLYIEKDDSSILPKDFKKEQISISPKDFPIQIAGKNLKTEALKEEGTKIIETQDPIELSNKVEDTIKTSSKDDRLIMENNREEGTSKKFQKGDHVTEIEPKITEYSSSSSKEHEMFSQPRYSYNPKPPYPFEARRKGYEGKVILKVEVLSNGNVGKIELKYSSGYKVLDNSAIETVKKWRFIPAMKNGESISYWVNIPILFRLK